MSIGTTDVILVLFGKAEALMLLLMAIGSAKTSDDNLTSLVVILSIPGAYFELKYFRMVLVSLGVILEDRLEEDIEMELVLNLYFFDNINIISVFF